jgi:preprotein translocase subunit SecY
VSIRAEGVTLAQHPVFAIYDMDWVSSPEFRQRLAVTALCLSVYLALGAIPLPGLYQEGVRSLEQSVPLRFSLLALGISPLFSAYLLFELLRLGVPRLRRWLDSSPACRTTGQRFVIGSAIAMTAVQAAGIASTMEGFPGLVRAPGIEFRIGFIVALTGATVVSIALAQIIGRHGLGGGLVWGMAALSAAGFAPQSFASFTQAFHFAASGQMGPGALAVLLLYYGLAFAVLVALGGRAWLFRTGGQRCDQSRKFLAAVSGSNHGVVAVGSACPLYAGRCVCTHVCLGGAAAVHAADLPVLLALRACHEGGPS